MSTPITHNTLLTIATVSLLKAYNVAKEDFLSLLCEELEETVGLYNYTDCLQCVQLASGRRLLRRALHFERSKKGFKHNAHQPLKVETLKKWEEDRKMISVTDTADQDGDCMGQYTDFLAAKTAFAGHYSGSAKEQLMAELVLECHLGIVDWRNDMMFRNLIKEKADRIVIAGKSYSKADGSAAEAFKKAKNFLQSMQQQAAEIALAKRIKFSKYEYEKLNDSIKKAYYRVFPQWIADNSVKYIGTIQERTTFEVSDDYKMLYSSKEDAINDAVAFAEICQERLTEQLMKMAMVQLI